MYVRIYNTLSYYTRTFRYLSFKFLANKIYHCIGTSSSRSNKQRRKMLSTRGHDITEKRTVVFIFNKMK